MKRYTEEHEWVEIQGEFATVGISSHATKELGDITFVELPEVDASFSQGDILSVVESVKAASDVYSPISGTVCEINSQLEEAPELMTESAENKGWICKMIKFKEDEVQGLMNEEEYLDFIG